MFGLDAVSLTSALSFLSQDIDQSTDLMMKRGSAADASVARGSQARDDNSTTISKLLGVSRSLDEDDAERDAYYIVTSSLGPSEASSAVKTDEATVSSDRSFLSSNSKSSLSSKRSAGLSTLRLGRFKPSAGLVSSGEPSMLPKPSGKASVSHSTATQLATGKTRTKNKSSCGSERDLKSTQFTNTDSWGTLFRTSESNSHDGTKVCDGISVTPSISSKRRQLKEKEIQIEQKLKALERAERRNFQREKEFNERMCKLLPKKRKQRSRYQLAKKKLIRVIEKELEEEGHMKERLAKISDAKLRASNELMKNEREIDDLNKRIMEKERVIKERMADATSGTPSVQAKKKLMKVIEKELEEERTMKERLAKISDAKLRASNELMKNEREINEMSKRIMEKERVIGERMAAIASAIEARAKQLKQNEVELKVEEKSGIKDENNDKDKHKDKLETLELGEKEKRLEKKEKLMIMELEERQKLIEEKELINWQREQEILEKIAALDEATKALLHKTDSAQQHIGQQHSQPQSGVVYSDLSADEEEEAKEEAAKDQMFTCCVFDFDCGTNSYSPTDLDLARMHPQSKLSRFINPKRC